MAGFFVIMRLISNLKAEISTHSFLKQLKPVDAKNQFHTISQSHCRVAGNV